MEIFLAGIAFVVLFLLWVVAPTFFRKRHNKDKKKSENSDQ